MYGGVRKLQQGNNQPVNSSSESTGSTVDGELTVSPKMSSLAIEDREELQSKALEEPSLYVIESRNRFRGVSQPLSSHAEEVIAIRGSFTVSF